MRLSHLSAALALALTASTAAQAQQFSSVVSFGDSLTDAGSSGILWRAIQILRLGYDLDTLRFFVHFHLRSLFSYQEKPREMAQRRFSNPGSSGRCYLQPHMGKDKV